MERMSQQPAPPPGVQAVGVPGAGGAPAQGWSRPPREALDFPVFFDPEPAVARYQQTLCGTFPGLSEHLARLERIRATDTNPDLEAV